MIYSFDLIISLTLLFLLFLGFSQLSDIHYLPPLKQYASKTSIREQAIYLSTPITTPFMVTIFRGASTTPLASILLSNANPVVYNLPNDSNDITLVSDVNTGVVINAAGLHFSAAGGELFYVNYRGKSAAQGTSLTSKGRAAMGTHFRWGGTPNKGNHFSNTSCLGIMATENNTTVSISGYNPDCVFRLQADPSGIKADAITVTLQAGESHVLEAIKDEAISNIDGWLGANITSNNKIVISNDGLNFGVRATSGSRDAGIDQPVPIDKLGAEHVFVRGNGGNDNEFAIIIGTANNTDIFLNGATTAIATINDGEYFEIPSANYSGTTAGENMYVFTSNDVYAYQVLSGDFGIQTVGLNFIAPVNCLLPNAVDNIPDIQSLVDITVDGGISIISATTTPDNNISVTDATGIVALPA